MCWKPARRGRLDRARDRRGGEREAQHRGADGPAGLGFDGYEDFREPFREAIRRGPQELSRPGRWLQDDPKSGRAGRALCRHGQARRCAIWKRPLPASIRRRPQGSGRGDLGVAQVFVLGVGVNNSNARNFTYLASTGMTQFHAIPRPGSTAVDDLAWADGQRDVLIAITCKPYRSEVVDAVAGRARAGCDGSSACPTARRARSSGLADHGFVVQADDAAVLPVVGVDHRPAGNAAELSSLPWPATRSSNGWRRFTPPRHELGHLLDEEDGPNDMQQPIQSLGSALLH